MTGLTRRTTPNSSRIAACMCRAGRTSSRKTAGASVGLRTACIRRRGHISGPTDADDLLVAVHRYRQLPLQHLDMLILAQVHVPWDDTIWIQAHLGLEQLGAGGQERDVRAHVNAPCG